VAGAASLDDVADLLEELTDRFGDPPKSVLNLLAVARLKVFGKLYGIESLARRGDDVLIKFAESRSGDADRTKLKALEQRFKGKLQVPPQESQLVLRLLVKGLDEDAMLAFVEEFLVQYKEVTKIKGELQDVAP